jgi:rhodanese-related sulfurtransferase
VEVKEVYRGEIEDLIQKGALLIDVREASDLDTAPALPGNRHVPLSRIAELAEDVKDERPLIFYCRSGVLSYRAAEIASTWIRKPVYYLAGGLLSDA